MIRYSDLSSAWFDYTTRIHHNAGCISATSVPQSDRLKSGMRGMSEINKRYFENLMADRRLSLRALATRMGMQHSQLSLTFSGARKLQLEEAAMLSSIFGEPLHRIFEAAGVNVTPVAGNRAQVIGTIGGDGTVSLYGPEIVERTNAPDGLPPESIAVQARTAGSQLGWMDGWVYFCRPHNGVDPALYGSLCLVKIKGGPPVVATVARGYKEGTVNLSGPYAAESVKMEWGTPVLLIRP